MVGSPGQLEPLDPAQVIQRPQQELRVPEGDSFPSISESPLEGLFRENDIKLWGTGWVTMGFQLELMALL